MHKCVNIQKKIEQSNISNHANKINNVRTDISVYKLYNKC